MKNFSDKEVRWGILGVGNVCEVKSAPAMNLIPNSRLVAVMRRNEAKAKDYAARHGVSKWYSDAQALIDDPEVNAIYIATPPDAHLELTRMAAAAGKPVYVEKPMARNHAECMKMIEVCEQANVPLFVAYYRRALPHFIKIKELMGENAIGAVRTVHINMRQIVEPEIITKLENNWRVIPEIAGGGYFYDLASHQLDLLDFFFGKITHTAGFCGNQAKAYEVEDMVVGSFVFEDGVFGTGNWCFSSSQAAEIDEIVIDGDKGQIRFATFGKGEFVLILDGKEPQLMQFELPKHIQQPLIQSIVDELLGDGLCASTGISGARANWVMGELIKKRIK